MISPYTAIDPGTKALGWARADIGGRIVAAGCSIAPPRIQELDARADYHARAIGLGSALTVWLESMVWTGGARRTTAQTLIDVQTVGCLVAAKVGANVRLTRPDEWKASIPKEIHHERILEQVLDAGERAIVAAACARAGESNAKEVLDAVGILVHRLGRSNKSGGARRA